MRTLITLGVVLCLLIGVVIARLDKPFESGITIDDSVPFLFSSDFAFEWDTAPDAIFTILYPYLRTEQFTDESGIKYEVKFTNIGFKDKIIKVELERTEIGEAK